MAKKSGKSQKQGRNKKWCEAYERSGQKKKNQILKLKRHLKRFPMDERVKILLSELGVRD